MKRIRAFLLVVLFILPLFGCNQSESRIDKENVAYITIALADSKNPTIKMIDQKEDADTVINYVNRLAKKKVELGHVMGWEVSIRIYDENDSLLNSVSLLENYIHIDDGWYKINKNEPEKLKELYHELDYEEKEWPR